MLANEAVGDDDLRQLALARSNAVKDYLTGPGGVEPARVFVLEPGAEARRAEGQGAGEPRRLLAEVTARESSSGSYTDRMWERTFLRDLAVVLAASFPVLFVCRRLKLPQVVGFLVTGVAIGPHALGWVRDADRVESIAEFGVALILLFVGLEFPIRRLKAAQCLDRQVFDLALNRQFEVCALEASGGVGGLLQQCRGVR